MKIDVCSDLHVDNHFHQTSLICEPGEGPQSWKKGHRGERAFFQHIDWEWYKNPDSTILVIAGDISNQHEDVMKVIDDALEVYEHVVYVDGNHEHYDDGELDVLDNCKLLHKRFEFKENVHYLDGHYRNHVEIDGVTFVGANGWYDFRCFESLGISYTQAIETWQARSNDSVHIRMGELVQPSNAARIHAERLAERVVSLPAGTPVVAITHSSPRAELMQWNPTDRDWNALTPAYVNTGMEQVRLADTYGNIKYWIYGHTHDRKMTERDGITYVNNSRGYSREQGRWFLVQLDV